MKLLTGLLCIFLTEGLYAESDSSIKAEIHSDASKIYLTLSFKDQDESRSESPWIWDQKTSSYKISSLKEDSLSVLIESQAGKGAFYDVWIWRAALSDPSGVAVDSWAPLAKSGLVSGIRPDAGELPWTLSCPSGYSGELVPRFRSRTPSGSLADVTASSEWKDGAWTLRLSRNLRSSSADDLDFIPGTELRLYVIRTAASSIELKNAASFSYRVPAQQGGGR